MILIADSGSTKTDWRLLQNGQPVEAINTIGFNPVLTNTAQITKELSKVFTNKTINQTINSVYYYGAGCWNQATCAVVSNALEVLFPNAIIDVTNDLLGAARAVCGKDAGITCILGTGANSCLYDGRTIIDNVPALGFIMGDEGSGAYLGKQLLKSHFYRELPKILSDKLLQEQPISKKIMLEQVYQSTSGNRYLASFAKFIIQEQTHPFMHQLVADAFDNFIVRQVQKYDGATNYPIHFIGSIAYFLKDILIERLEKSGLQIGNIIRQPIDGLVDFHK
ncbi:MAG: hypothetical protein AB8G86_05065 [Saprospiraceae bacterium]